MGTIAEKSEYLTETKDKIKESINNLGGSITSETTFREYAEELDTIYSNLPKVTGENTEVTLTPTLKGKLGIVEKGNSTQESTNGYNLVNYDNTQVTLVKSTSRTITITPTNFPITLQAGTYTLSVPDLSLSNSNYGLGINMALQPSGTTPVGFIQADTKKISFTINEETTYRGLYFYMHNSDNDNATATFSKIMLEKGSTAHNWEQYTGGIPAPNPNYSFPIKSVTGNNNVVVRNSDNTQSQTLPLNLGSIELNKIGEWQDYIYKNNNKWYIKKQIGKYILGETTTVRSGSVLGETKKYVTFANVTNAYGIDAPYFNILSNKIISSNGTPSLYSGYLFNQTLVVVVDDNDTKDTVNQKIQGATLLYQLGSAGFTDTEITDTTLIEQLEEIDKMKSYEGTTIITSTYEEGNAQMIISGSALKGE